MSTTARFTASDGVAIAHHRFEPVTAAELPLVVLQHGFAADTTSNWVAPGIVDALLADGRRVLSVDARGHGVSDKPHDRAFYGDGRMSADLIELFDALSLAEVDLVGYSMGAIVAVITAGTDHRIRRMVVGGIGGSVARPDDAPTNGDDRSAVAAALLADDPDTVTDPTARAFRRFADSTGADRHALAAQMQAVDVSAIALDEITAQTLLLVGDDDQFARQPDELAGTIRDCELTVVAGDHLGAVAAPGFAPAIVEFLAR